MNVAETLDACLHLVAALAYEAGHVRIEYEPPEPPETRGVYTLDAVRDRGDGCVDRFAMAVECDFELALGKLHAELLTYRDAALARLTHTKEEETP